MDHDRSRGHGSCVMLLWHEFLNVESRGPFSHVGFIGNGVHILGNIRLVRLAVNEHFVV